jgi:4-amino-4-deoxy-L-arabinose transferase-like glycosyltransferase
MGLERNHFSDFRWLNAHWEWVLALLCLPLALIFFDDFGLTWDTSAHLEYGQRTLDYYQSGFSYARSFESGNIDDKGPGFVFLNSFLHWLFKLEPLKLWHLLISFCAILTLPPLAAIGRLLGHQRVAVFGVLALLLMPRFIGHSFTNPIDIPFACAVCWSMFAMLRLYHKNRFSKLDLCFCALTIGLALSMRPGGMFLFFYMAAIGLLQTIQTGSSGQNNFFRKIFCLAVRLTIVFVLAWIIMITFWPYAHQNPILNPLKAMQTAKNFNLSYPVLFMGNIFMSDHLPWYYMIWFLIISTPMNILLLIAVGFINGVTDQLRSWNSSRSLMIFGIQIWTLFPILYFIAFTPNIYDGIRHILFILPGLALFAGLGADYLFQQMRRYMDRTIAAMATTTILLLSIGSIFTMHPYQSSYFNLVAGSSNTLHNRYETDYWVSSYKEGAEWINQRQAETDRPLKILVAANSLSSLCARYYLDKNTHASFLFQTVKEPKLPDGFDYYISTVRYGLHQNFSEEPVVHFIARTGVLLSIIKGKSRVATD